MMPEKKTSLTMVQSQKLSFLETSLYGSQALSSGLRVYGFIYSSCEPPTEERYSYCKFTGEETGKER